MKAKNIAICNHQTSLKICREHGSMLVCGVGQRCFFQVDRHEPGHSWIRHEGPPEPDLSTKHIMEYGMDMIELETRVTRIEDVEAIKQLSGRPVALEFIWAWVAPLAKYMTHHPS